MVKKTYFIIYKQMFQLTYWFMKLKYLIIYMLFIGIAAMFTVFSSLVFSTIVIHYLNGDLK